MDNIQRKCSKCAVSRPLSEFYKKGLRADSHCKSCKKALVVARRIEARLVKTEEVKSSIPEITKRNRPETIIEPRNQETNQIINSIDFRDVERIGGKQLTRVGKQDAVLRFNEFIALLLDGYSELKGEDVYLKS